jgi:hypothetical protein
MHKCIRRSISDVFIRITQNGTFHGHDFDISRRENPDVSSARQPHKKIATYSMKVSYRESSSPEILANAVASLLHACFHCIPDADFDRSAFPRLEDDVPGGSVPCPQLEVRRFAWVYKGGFDLCRQTDSQGSGAPSRQPSRQRRLFQSERSSAGN